MRVPTHHHRGTGSVDQVMTPMIDVVFQLLIFFVCASVGQIRESLLPSDLAAGSVEGAQADPESRPLGEVWLFLTSAPDGETRVQVNRGGETYSDFALLRQTLLAVAETAREVPVILDIAPTVPMGDMIAVYDVCREAGFDSVNFATRAE